MFTKTKKALSFTLLTMLVGLTSIALASDFAMQEVKVENSKVLEVSFTNDLAEGSDELSEFMLTKKSDNTSEVAIESLESVSSNTLKINLANDLESNTEYDLTAIFVANAEGTVIESGASGIATFTTPDFSVENTQEEVVVEETSSGEVAPELNSASEEVVTEETSSGELLVEETAAAEVVATEANMTEVETGAKETILVLLALLLAFLFISARRKA